MSDKDIALQLENDGYFTIIKELGSGAFGSVFLVKRKNKIQALKLIGYHRSLPNPTISEIDILETIKKYGYFPHIYEVINFGIFDKNIIYIGIFMEYIQGETLYKIYEKKIKLSQTQILIIFFNLLDALSILQKHGIAHRDIKDENIILTDKGIKIIDFGLACKYKITQPSVVKCIGFAGTPLFMPPEENPNSQYTIDYSKVDIWSVGEVLYELITLKEPKENVRLSDLKNINEEIAKLILTMLSKNPEDRPMANEALYSLQKIVKRIRKLKPNYRCSKYTKKMCVDKKVNSKRCAKYSKALCIRQRKKR